MRKRPRSECASPTISSSDIFHVQDRVSPQQSSASLSLPHIWQECEYYNHNATEVPANKQPCDIVSRRNLRLRRNSDVFSCYAESYRASPLPMAPVKPRKAMPKRHRRPSKLISICGLCFGSSDKNLNTNLPEDLIACWSCGQAGHPTCLKMPPELVTHIRSLRWCCVDCKRCCLCSSDYGDSTQVNTETGSDLLLCDSCDRGFHMSCLDPPVPHLPEGNWICPICSSESNEHPSGPIDPRLEAIQLSDQLTQSEIDWMHRILNLRGQACVSALSPSVVTSTRLSTGSAHRHSPLSSPASSTLDAPQSVMNTSDQVTAVKLSKRLVQKSLASWTIPKSRTSPSKPRESDDSSALTPSSLAPYRRRTSQMANHAWQSLVRRRLSHASARRGKNSGHDEEEDDDKTDISTNEPESVVRHLSNRYIRSNRRSRFGIRRRRRSRLRARISAASPSSLPGLHRRDTRLISAQNDISPSQSFVSPLRRARCRLSHMRTTRGVSRAHSRSLARKHDWSMQRERFHRAWQLSRSHRLRPSISTLKRWSALGVNIKQALTTFQHHGRVRLSSLPRAYNRHTGSNLVSSWSKLDSSLKMSPMKDGEVSDEDEDDDSSVTVAAADLDTVSDTKCQGAFEHFDPNNDECPEFAVITDENRALFAEIQADVQACLPQPMESSLSLPPANNPKLLLSKESADSKYRSNCLTDAIDAEKPEEQRYPPRIQLGRHIITTWYSAPYPSEYARLNLLYICEFCLKYSKTRKVYMRHIEKCPFSFPPGNEIYRCGKVSVFEVDGYTSRLYCQQLCLLAKLFLDHKTLYYDVEPFLFYVVALREDNCFHLVGYFSKEKRSAQKFNLSCLMVLPPYQKLAYGRFLIDFSFLLSRIEGQPGSPEKPLSELGRLSYESYWRSKVLPFLLDSFKCDAVCDESEPMPSNTHSLHCRESVFTIHQITACTGIDPHDVASTIEQLATSIQLGSDGRPVMYFDKTKLLQLEAKYNARKPNWIPVDEECLRWSPLIHPLETDVSADNYHTNSEIISIDGDGNPDPYNTPIHTAASSEHVFQSRPVCLNVASVSSDSVPSVETRRSLRGASVHNLESAEIDSATSAFKVQSRKCSLRSHVFGSTHNEPPDSQCRTHLSSYTTSTPTVSSLSAQHISPSLEETNAPRTVRCTRSTPPSGGIPRAGRHITLSRYTQRRNRKFSKKPNHSSCRQNPFFRDGSEPPDPPPPNCDKSDSRAISSGTRPSEYTHAHAGGRQRSIRSGHSDDQHNDGTMGLNGPSVMDQQGSLVDERSFIIRVNSSLPESDNLSPLKPAHSSSPRALFDQLLEQRLCVEPCSPAESPCLPPSLTPPPPTLSLLGGVDSALAEYPTSLPRDTASLKDCVVATAPPCLSFYDSLCHPPSSDEPWLPNTDLPTAHADQLPKSSTKSPVRNIHSKSQPCHTDLSASVSILHRQCSLAVGLSRNGSAVHNGLNTVPTPPDTSPSSTSVLTSPQLFAFPPSPEYLSSNNLTCVCSVRRGRSDPKSCPTSPLRSTSCDLIPRQCPRRSASMSVLQKVLHEAELPSVTRHSPSHSPPSLPSPAFDVLTNQIPVLIPSLSESNVHKCSGSTRCAPRSPSPPLLTNVCSTNLSKIGTTYGMFSVCDSAPLLFPSKVTQLPTDHLSQVSSLNEPITSHLPVPSLLDPASDTNDSDTSSDTLPMCLDDRSYTRTSSITDFHLAGASLSPVLLTSASPLSHNSSVETLAMRLSTPSPQLSDDDEDIVSHPTPMLTQFDSAVEITVGSRSRYSSAPGLCFSPSNSPSCRNIHSCPSRVSSPLPLFTEEDDRSQSEFHKPAVSVHPRAIFDCSSSNGTLANFDLRAQVTSNKSAQPPAIDLSLHPALRQLHTVLTPETLTPMSIDVRVMVASQSCVAPLPRRVPIQEVLFSWDTFTCCPPLYLCVACHSSISDCAVQRGSVSLVSMACSVQMRLRPTLEESAPNYSILPQNLLHPLQVTTTMTAFGRQISSDPVALPSASYTSCVGRSKRRRSESSFKEVAPVAQCGSSLPTNHPSSVYLQFATEGLQLSRCSPLYQSLPSTDRTTISAQHLSNHLLSSSRMNLVAPASLTQPSTRGRNLDQSQISTTMSFDPNICANKSVLEYPNPFLSDRCRTPSNTPYPTTNVSSVVDRVIRYSPVYSSLSSTISSPPAYISSPYPTSGQPTAPYDHTFSSITTAAFRSPTTAQPRCSFRSSKKRPYPVQRNRSNSKHSTQLSSLSTYSSSPKFDYSPFFPSSGAVETPGVMLQSSPPITFPPPTLLSEPQSSCLLPPHVSSAPNISEPVPCTATNSFFQSSFMGTSTHTYERYMVPYDLSAPPTLSVSPASNINNPSLSSFVEQSPFCASVPVVPYSCSVPSRDFSLIEPTLGNIPTQHHSCVSETFSPIMSMSQIYGNHRVFVDKKPEADAVCFSTSFQPPEASIAPTNPVLCPSHIPERMRFMPTLRRSQETTTDPSDITGLPGNIFDVSSLPYATPTIEPTHLNPVLLSPQSVGALSSAFPATDSNLSTPHSLSTFTCPTTLYNSVSNSAPQQFLFCPPLFIYPSESSNLSEFFSLPTTSPSFTPMNDGGYPTVLPPMPTYPVAASNNFNWSHNDLISGQTIPQSVLPHPMMPT